MVQGGLLSCRVADHQDDLVREPVRDAVSLWFFDTFVSEDEMRAVVDGAAQFLLACGEVERFMFHWVPFVLGGWSADACVFRSFAECVVGDVHIYGGGDG